MDDSWGSKFRNAALFAGVLMLFGAGCNPFSDRGRYLPSTMPAVAFEKLQFFDAGDRSYVQGVNRVCNLNNAAVLFEKDADWNEIKNEIAKKESEGWKLGAFCFERGAGIGFLLYEDDLLNGGLIIMVGREASADEKVSYTNVEFVGDTITEHEIVLDFKKRKESYAVVVTMIEDDLTAEWREQVLVEPKEKTLKMTRCALKVNSLLPGQKQPEICND